MTMDVRTEGLGQSERRRVWCTKTTAINSGEPFAFNFDTGTASSAEGDRGNHVETLSTSNMEWFAGVAARDYSANSSGQWIELVTPGSYFEVRTNANCTIGTTTLFAVPSTAYLTSSGGIPVATALQTVDRSSTTGTCFAYIHPTATLANSKWWGTASGKGLSPIIWSKCPLNLIRSNPQYGYHFFDDFVAMPTHTGTDPGTVGTMGSTYIKLGPYNVYTSAGSVITSGDELGGTVVLTPDASDESCGMQAGIGAFRIDTTNAKKLWFEARFKLSSITAGVACNAFVGLVDAGTLTHQIPLDSVVGATLGTADTGLSDNAMIGWWVNENDPDALTIISKVSSTPQVILDNAVTLVADTYVKVGMYFDGSTLYFYENGVAESATLTSTEIGTTGFPDAVYLAPTVAAMGPGTNNPGSIELDWWACAQER